MESWRDTDTAAVGGCGQVKRRKRQEAGQFAKHGIRIPGFEPITNFSYSFMKSLIDLSPSSTSPDEVSEIDIAAFLARAMVPYARAVAFAVQPNDPHEFRTALADGLRRAVGFSDDAISAEKFLDFLGQLVENVNEDAKDLPKPFGMLHLLVMDFVQTRRDNPRRPQHKRREMKYRHSQLQNVNYWNGIANSLAQYLTWLKQHPDFIESHTVPPFSYNDNVPFMEGGLEELDGKPGKSCITNPTW